MKMFAPLIGRVINVIKSCKVIEVNPPLYVEALDPKVREVSPVGKKSS